MANNRPLRKMQIGISLDIDIVKEIDDVRGIEPRSAYINELLKEKLQAPA